MSEIEIPNVYSKQYFEYYALLSVNHCFDSGLSVTNKAEHPDWYNSDISMGLEVTRSLSKHEGEKLKYTNEYFNKGLSYETIKNDISKRCPILAEEIKSIDGITCRISDVNVADDKRLLMNSIINKSCSLFDKVEEIEHIWLYVFASSSVLEREDIEEIVKQLDKTCIFERIFINCCDCVYCVFNRQVEKFVFSENELRDIKRLSMLYANYYKNLDEYNSIFSELSASAEKLANSIKSQTFGIASVINEIDLNGLKEQMQELSKGYLEMLEGLKAIIENSYPEITIKNEMINSAKGVLFNNQIVYWEELDKEKASKIIDNKYSLYELLGNVDYFDLIKTEDREGLINTNLFSQCEFAFKRGLYAICVIGLTSIVDGLLSLLSGDKKTTNIKNRLESMIKKAEFKKSEEHLSINMMIYTLQSFTERFIEKTDFNFAEPININRHWIMHGRSKREYTAFECMQLCRYIYGILLLNAATLI